MVAFVITPTYLPLSLLLLVSNSLKRHIQLLFAFLGCLHLCGGPLGLMQGVAWVGMTISYSSQDGIVEGLKKTFDGEHPCALCCAIAKVKSSEKNEKPAPTAPSMKELKLGKDLSLMNTVHLPELARRELFTTPRHPHVILTGAGQLSPPVPPPRSC